MAEDPTDDLCLEQLFKQKETEDFDEVVAQKLQSSQVTTEKNEQPLHKKPEDEQKPKKKTAPRFRRSNKVAPASSCKASNKSFFKGFICCIFPWAKA